MIGISYNNPQVLLNDQNKIKVLLRETTKVNIKEFDKTRNRELVSANKIAKLKTIFNTWFNRFGKEVKSWATLIY